MNTRRASCESCCLCRDHDGVSVPSDDHKAAMDSIAGELMG